MKKTRLEKAIDEYFEKFGKNYPLSVVETRGDEEIAKEIEENIKNGQEAMQPKYEKGVVY